MTYYVSSGTLNPTHYHYYYRTVSIQLEKDEVLHKVYINRYEPTQQMNYDMLV